MSFLQEWPCIPLLLLAFSVRGQGTPFNRLRTVDWFGDARQMLKHNLEMQHIVGRAKNVILFIGDGMGISTITAARLRLAQQQGRTFHDTHLAFEVFPHLSLSKTYEINQVTPESGGSATAIYSGVKTNGNVLAVEQSVRRGDCSAVTEATKLKSALTFAHEEGKWTGIISTNRLTDATPAAAYAYSSERNWEADSDMPASKKACKDIAKQFVEDSNYIRVAMSGGKQKFLPSSEPDGDRMDQINLTDQWVDIQTSKVGRDRVKYVQNQAEFDSVNPEETDYLLGLFDKTNMQFETDRTDEPSIVEMTEKAIRMLTRNERGYFLIVEGARIDHAHHVNNAYKATQDTIAFSQAVQKAVDMTNTEDTLIVVTADHSHGLSINEYNHPDDDILGLAHGVVDGRDMRELLTTDDLKPWLALSYANGPGWFYHRTQDGTIGTPQPRLNLTSVDTTVKEFQQDSAVPFEFSKHSGEDVPVFAQGPMAHLFQGVHEQNYIAHVMMHAACLGPYRDYCPSDNPKPKYREDDKTQGGSSMCEIVSVLSLFIIGINIAVIVLAAYWMTRVIKQGIKADHIPLEYNGV